jgi:hypothetical protein
MSDHVLALFVIVVAVTLSVWAVALASQTVDLGILPARRRHRAEWCRLHERQVVITGAALTGLLVCYQLLAA